MNCRELFEWRCNYALDILQLVFEKRYNFNFEHIKNHFTKRLSFSSSNHVGGLVPLYYNSGIPAKVWRCVRCHEFVCF